MAGRKEAREQEDEWQQVNVVSSLAPPGEGRKRSEIPSRPELLTIVRKNSQGLEKADGKPDEQLVKDRQFWQELLDMFFVRGLVEIKADKSDQDDDLVFFVRMEGIQNGTGKFHESDDSDMQAFFVRRWAPELQTVIGNNVWQVDWCRSFYLNLIAHTSFSLTIAICSRESLRNHQSGAALSPGPIHKVTKTVYASPSRTNFQRDAKATETVASYPDICFVVDDYDYTFNQVVLTNADHCYCVILNACGGASFPDDESSGVRISREAKMLGELEQGSSSSLVTLFSGLVSYDLVHAAFVGGKRTTIDDLFHRAESQVKPEKLIMRGPGGRGALEVAVSAVPDLEKKQRSSTPPPSPSKPAQKAGLGAIMQKAASVASNVAKNVVAAAASEARFDEPPSPLRCCLMTLSLPWDAIAKDLLFKDLPGS